MTNMLESDHIELAQLGSKQYARVEQGNVEEIDEEIEDQTSVSFARKMKQTERKKLRRWKVVSFVVCMTLWQLWHMCKKDALSQTDQQIANDDNATTSIPVKDRPPTVQEETDIPVKQEKQSPKDKQSSASETSNIVKQEQPSPKTNHKTINKTPITAEFIPVPNEFQFNDNVLHRPTNEHEVHIPETFPYRTLGMREPGQKFNRTAVSLSDYARYQQLMDSLFKPYNNTDCKLQRYGDKQDGGYLLCGNFLNHSEALINLGVEGSDVFGCDVSTAALMPNYQYDCTNNKAPQCTTNSGLNHFQATCLGERTEKSEGNQFYSLKDILDSRNLTRRHVSMKIDVQGAEWPGLRAFPFEYLDYIDQFVFQIHLKSGTINYEPVWGNLDILNSLSEKFASVTLHMNNHACILNYQIAGKMRYYPSFAIQVTLVNRDLLTIIDQSRSYWLHPEHRPNRFGNDCQLHD